MTELTKLLEDRLYSELAIIDMRLNLFSLWPGIPENLSGELKDLAGKVFELRQTIEREIGNQQKKEDNYWSGYEASKGGSKT